MSNGITPVRLFWIHTSSILYGGFNRFIRGIDGEPTIIIKFREGLVYT